MAFATVSDVVEYIKEEGIRFLDVRFTDVPGTEHHFTIPAEEFDEGLLSRDWLSMAPRCVDLPPSMSQI